MVLFRYSVFRPDYEKTPDHLTKNDERKIAFKLFGQIPSRNGWINATVIIFVKDYFQAQAARHQIPHMRVNSVQLVKEK